MIWPTPLRLIFITFCLAIIFLQDVLTYVMFKNNNEYKVWIVWPVSVGLFGTIAYSLFLLVDQFHHFLAVLFDSLFFISTDWLAILMLLFAITYTGISVRNRRKVGIICGILCLIDSVSLFVNIFTHHMFDLELKYDAFGNFYWANNFKWPHFIHLGMCYLMVSLTMFYFAYITYTSAKVYKSKYGGILAAYIVVISANLICYSLNFPIDCSVLLYGILAGFICYHSAYTFPHNLLSSTLESVNETISDAVLYFDYDGNCIYANRVARLLFTNEKNKFSKSKAEEYRKKWLLLHPETEKQDIENDFYAEDLSLNGKKLFIKVEYQLSEEDKRFANSFMRLIDKTIEHENYEKDRYAATHDELTGLLNRTGFFEAVDSWNKEHGGTTDRVMICSNIKDFKLINEYFGEQIGDNILKRVAEYLKTGSHVESIYGRIGDDKFGLYTSKEIFSESELENYINNVKSITEESVYRIHINVGVYDPNGRYENAQIMTDKSLMAISTMANDYNKVFSYYDSILMEKLLNEKNIIQDFQGAIEKGQIQMYLQPIIDNSNLEVGAEALCRWKHPLRGLLKPADFLPILEKNGLIYQLDEYIWEQAAKKLGQWSVNGCKNCYISVNVSVKDFFFTDVYKTFTSLTEKYDFNPSMLHIEITESVLMSDYAKSFMLSNKLQKFGFVVAIDNFGSGYSSLNMLKDLRPSVLKIDMALYNNLDELYRNQVILTAIVDMAHTLNMKVIGEGVESDEQYNSLLNLHCSLFQGNLFEVPMPVEEYETKFIKDLINKK